MATKRTDEQTNEAAPDPNKETVTFVWRGTGFVVPKRQGRWPTESLRAFSERRMRTGMSILLGDKQWVELLKVAPVGDDFSDFADKFGDFVQENVTP